MALKGESFHLDCRLEIITSDSFFLHLKFPYRILCLAKGDVRISSRPNLET